MIYMPRRIKLAFGGWNYDFEKNMYYILDGKNKKYISPECAEEMGVIIRKYNEIYDKYKYEEKK